MWIEEAGQFSPTLRPRIFHWLSHLCELTDLPTQITMEPDACVDLVIWLSILRLSNGGALGNVASWRLFAPITSLLVSSQRDLSDSSTLTRRSVIPISNALCCLLKPVSLTRSWCWLHLGMWHMTYFKRCPQERPFQNIICTLIRVTQLCMNTHKV